MRIKDLAPRVTKLLTGNAWFVVDNGTKVEKVAYSEVVKQGIEDYAGSTLAGSAQTVKSAINALNSKTSAFQNIPPLSSVNVGGNKKLVLTMNAGSANYRGFLVLFVQGNTTAGDPQICMFSWGNGGTAVTVSHVLGANTVYDGATIDGSNTTAVKVSIPMVSYETISAFASANVVSGVLTIEDA